MNVMYFSYFQYLFLLSLLPLSHAQSDNFFQTFQNVNYQEAYFVMLILIIFVYCTPFILWIWRVFISKIVEKIRKRWEIIRIRMKEKLKTAQKSVVDQARPEAATNI
jgi:hypothetical protein